MQERAWCAPQCHQISSSLIFFSTPSLCFSRSPSLSSPLLSFCAFPPFLFLPACVLSYCFPISWPASHFLPSFLPSSFLLLVFPLRASLSFICLSFLFAPPSRAPLHWAACNHICTTSCQFDRIHASVFCHLRRKRDWSFFVMFKLYQWGQGFNGIHVNVTYCGA